jgi:membrane associated rhomboid family serine protease
VRISSTGVETCYRHPGRETGVSCSSCGRPICPDCMTPTSVGMRCPECAPGKSRVQRAAATVAPDTPIVTYVVMALCVIVFLGSLAGGMTIGGGNLFGSPLARNFALAGPLVADGDVWRLVTYSFVHSGIIHIGFNLFILWQLGSMLEPAIGRLQFGVIYFVSVLSGALGSLLIDPNVGTVGASGGVFGLASAAIVILRSRGIDPMQSGLPLFIGLNLLITFTLPNVSIGGHIGGLVGGALAGLALAELPRAVRGLPRFMPVLAAAGVGVLAVVGALAVA